MTVDSLTSVAGALCCLVLVVVVPVVFISRRRHHRDGSLATWADTNAWTVVADPDVDWYRRLPGRNPDGVTMAVSRVIDGHLVSVGRYLVTDAQVVSTADPNGGVSTTTTVSTNHYVVVVVRLHRSLPATAVERRGTLSRLGHRLVGSGRSATGNRAFDRAWRIDTTDPTLIPRWCTPELITHHLAHRPPAWSVHRDELLCYIPGQLRPDQIPNLVAPALRLAVLLS